MADAGAAVNDTGAEFEVRALEVARAIHDPGGHQGAIMFRGREHDGVFVSDTAVVAFEFTKHRKKEKALKDAQKIADLLQHLSSLPEHKFKSFQGYFVSESEPTAEQRQAVDGVSKATGVPIKALAIGTLQKQLIDAEEYLRTRLAAPFGSTSFMLSVADGRAVGADYVDASFEHHDTASSLDDLAGRIQAGERLAIVADFGAGKSEALKQLFLRLRKKYFKAPLDSHLPIHINLRECYGLRSPAEVLRRHAEEIGFSNERSLIAAWRAGACILLLDGFDEVIPVRWVGGAKNLRDVRWSALEAVRRLVEDTPAGGGVAVAGRPQYFSNDDELRQTLGIGVSGEIFRLRDFDERQISAFLGAETVLPDWMPTRPLLLKFLVSSGLVDAVNQTQGKDEGAAWVEILDLLARRESQRITSISPATVKALIARIATIARASEAGLGPINLEEMRAAFKDVCGYDVDEDGIQLLLRLPGLASEATSPVSSTESRTFVDRSIAEAAYGHDLARYAQAPFEAHPLEESATWAANARRLAHEVALSSLQESGFEASFIATGLQRRLDLGRNDAVMLDLIGMAEAAELPGSQGSQPFFNELLVDELRLQGTTGWLSASVFRDCIVERLVVADVDAAEQLPVFQRTMIGTVEGWSSLPDEYSTRFIDCEFGEFTVRSQTTAGLLELDLSAENRIALVILKKIYNQAGGARRTSALARGIPPAQRGFVEPIVGSLESAGLLTRVNRRSVELVAPVKWQRGRVSEILKSPASFNLSSLR